ncbi:hypothetical protein CVT25_002999 [Psilocybe cyanescens]|uniref:Uncharacterized protein n=1 Tax=Psilocybe cyanescens TaxID=93625 RepID=A0A409WN45_PSICY|nr:hypothetical protein CVT25_002999 [Psilocybe cyanescens]
MSDNPDSKKNTATGIKAAYASGKKPDSNVKNNVYQDIFQKLTMLNYKYSITQIKSHWQWDRVKKRKYNEYKYWQIHSFHLYNALAELISDTMACGDQAFSSASGNTAPTIFNDDIAQEIQGDDEPSQEDKGTQTMTLNSNDAPLMSSSSVSEATTYIDFYKPANISCGSKHMATPPATPAHKHV